MRLSSPGVLPGTPLSAEAFSQGHIFFFCESKCVCRSFFSFFFFFTKNLCAERSRMKTQRHREAWNLRTAETHQTVVLLQMTLHLSYISPHVARLSFFSLSVLTRPHQAQPASPHLLISISINTLRSHQVRVEPANGDAISEAQHLSPRFLSCWNGGNLTSNTHVLSHAKCCGSGEK